MARYRTGCQWCVGVGYQALTIYDYHTDFTPARGGLFNPPQTFEFWHDVQHNITIKTLRRGEYPVALRYKIKCRFTIAPGVYKSADGTKVVRLTDSDLAKTNNHAGAPHINFETGKTVTKPNGKPSFISDKNNHVFLPEEN